MAPREAVSARCANIERAHSDAGVLNLPGYQIGDILLADHGAKTITKIGQMQKDPRGGAFVVPQSVKEHAQKTISLEDAVEVEGELGALGIAEVDIRRSLKGWLSFSFTTSGYDEINNVVQEANTALGKMFDDNDHIAARPMHYIFPAYDKLTDKSPRSTSVFIVSKVVYGSEFRVEMNHQAQTDGELTVWSKALQAKVSVHVTCNAAVHVIAQLEEDVQKGDRVPELYKATEIALVQNGSDAKQSRFRQVFEPRFDVRAYSHR